MKIIKRGQLPQDKVINAKCANCNTEVEFRVSEARLHSNQHDGSAYIWTCPVCSKENWADAALARNPLPPLQQHEDGLEKYRSGSGYR